MWALPFFLELRGKFVSLIYNQQGYIGSAAHLRTVNTFSAACFFPISIISRLFPPPKKNGCSAKQLDLAMGAKVAVQAGSPE